ncbi:MAG: prolipoprotein diacylglyceryl transferase [Clostridiales bacterium]|nr:prolipoprotein diacylglyceryl transferase [Clostridiales bacterium]
MSNPFLPLPLAAIHLYGLLIAAALGIAAWLCTLEEKRLALPKDTGIDIVLYALPPALIISRLYYVAFTWEMFRHDPLSILKIWEGGLAIYGAVIGGALGVWLLSRRKGVPFMTLADVVAPALILGQAIGRWGNYFNGEAFGYAVSNPAWQFFPFAVRIGAGWHLATFFYESVWNLLGFAFLYVNRARFQREGRFGHVFFWYLLWYGLGRLVIEGLRTDSLMWGSVRVSQLLSLLLCALAAVKMMLDLYLPKAWLILPALALAAPFVLPHWWGIGAAWALSTCSAVVIYTRYPARKAAA